MFCVNYFCSIRLRFIWYGYRYGSSPTYDKDPYPGKLYGFGSATLVSKIPVPLSENSVTVWAPNPLTTHVMLMLCLAYHLHCPTRWPAAFCHLLWQHFPSPTFLYSPAPSNLKVEKIFLPPLFINEDHVYCSRHISIIITLVDFYLLKRSKT